MRGVTERRIESLGALDRGLDGSAVVVGWLVGWLVFVVVRVSRGWGAVGTLNKQL